MGTTVSRSIATSCAGGWALVLAASLSAQGPDSESSQSAPANGAILAAYDCAKASGLAAPGGPINSHWEVVDASNLGGSASLYAVALDTSRSSEPGPVVSAGFLVYLNGEDIRVGLGLRGVIRLVRGLPEGWSQSGTGSVHTIGEAVRLGAPGGEYRVKAVSEADSLDCHVSVEGPVGFSAKAKAGSGLKYNATVQLAFRGDNLLSATVQLEGTAEFGDRLASIPSNRERVFGLLTQVPYSLARYGVPSGPYSGMFAGPRFALESGKGLVIRELCNGAIAFSVAVPASGDAEPLVLRGTSFSSRPLGFDGVFDDDFVVSACAIAPFVKGDSDRQVLEWALTGSRPESESVTCTRRVSEVDHWSAVDGNVWGVAWRTCGADKCDLLEGASEVVVRWSEESVLTLNLKWAAKQGSIDCD